MPISHITTEINRFLSSTNPEVICIKGKWGVGKTYAWRSFLKAAQDRKAIGLDQYSYVSLFGRNSLTDLRNAVVENSVGTTDVTAKPSISSLEDATSLLKKGFNKAGFFAQYLPKSDKYAEGLQRLMFLFVRNKLICLDDLERAGSGLNLKDVLGLAAHLRDEKSCKVVILLNDEKLDGKSKTDFEEQLEKIADITFSFDPTSTEAAEIAIDRSTSFHEAFNANCIKLGITNIRVIKKAESFCRKLEEILVGLDDRVFKQSVHTTTLACFSKFQPDTAPTLEYIKHFNPYVGLWSSRSTGDKVEPDPFRDLLRSYDFSNVDEFDQAVIDGISRGYFDEQVVRTLGEAANNNLTLSDQSSSYRSAWSLYSSSFDQNEREFVDGLDSAIRNNISVIDPPNLDSAVHVIRELGFSQKASDAISFYIENKQGDAETWNPENFSYRGRLRDQEFIDACNAKFATFVTVINPTEVLKKVGNSQSWNRKDDALLASLSPNDFFDMFKAARGDDLMGLISGAKLYISIGNPSPDVAKIQTSLKAAMTQIAKESPLNERRVRGYFEIEP